MPEAVLVTGAAGFIGAHVTRCLLDRGYRVVGLDDLSGGQAAQVDPRATLVRGSILDHGLVDELFETHRFAYVFHFAAYAAEGLSHFVRRFNYQNNLVGSVNLVNAAVRADVRGFVFASSIAVYGGAIPPVTEDTPLSPEDPYGVAKAAVEQDLRIAAETFGLRSIVFRPHNVYGEGQSLGDPYRNVVGIFMQRILRGEPLPIFGDGRQTRAFSYIGDVAPTIARSIEVPEAYGQAFNIGADRPVSVRALAETVSEAMGVPCRPEFLPARVEVQHIHADHAKARAVLGFEDRTPLEAGVRRMAEWARSVGPGRRTATPAVEVERNLPEAWRGSVDPRDPVA